MSRTVSLRSVFALLLAAVCASASHAEPVLKPVDEAMRDPGFFSFRARLQVALAQHDVAALRTMIDPGIRTSFGGGGGLADFEAQWKVNEDTSPVWRELATVIALGGAFDEHGNFFAPYVFARWPEAIDSYQYLVAIGDNVRVRAEPDAKSTAIDRLDFEIVARHEKASGDERWIAVRLADGRRGFVARELLRAPLEYRAIFGRVDGRWLLQAFVEGD